MSRKLEIYLFKILYFVHVNIYIENKIYGGVFQVSIFTPFWNIFSEEPLFS